VPTPRHEKFEVDCSSDLHHKVEKIYIWAFSPAQAKKIAAIKFNKKFGFADWSYVEMEAKPVPQTKEPADTDS